MNGRRLRSPGIVVRAAVLGTLFALAVSGVSAQKVHRIPFASRGNVVELLLEAPSPSAIPGVKVRMTDHPSWVEAAPGGQPVTGYLLPGKPKTASFTFSVDRSAPVGSVHQLSFEVSSAAGERWAKSISISVLPPERFELRQNYPNPFNPATTITFLLPRSSEVSLIVYTLLGEEVAMLVRGTLEPGYHEALWDASAMASGMYLYRLTTPGTVLTGRMMLIR